MLEIQSLKNSRRALYTSRPFSPDRIYLINFTYIIFSGQHMSSVGSPNQETPSRANARESGDGCLRSLCVDPGAEELLGAHGPPWLVF